MQNRRRDTWVPVAAAAAVAVAALGAAIMSKRGESTAPASAMLAQSTQQGARGADAGAQSAASEPKDLPPSPAGQAAPVVKAPPLKPPPKPPVTSFARNGPAVAQPGSGAMGSPAACANCGTIEMVVAVLEHGKQRPSGYQMHIRMDDGSMRTIEQRGALAAGSRVRVEKSAVKALSPDG